MGFKWVEGKGLREGWRSKELWKSVEKTKAPRCKTGTRGTRLPFAIALDLHASAELNLGATHLSDCKESLFERSNSKEYTYLRRNT